MIFKITRFDRENWLPKTVQQHKQTVQQILLCNTKTGRSEIESKSGYCNTALLRLPYFSPSRMLVIDSMHNLFLGTAKHFLKSVWLDKKILLQSDFSIIQSRIDRTVVPSDIGRIPYKVLSGFSSFTADQFKNWVLYISLLSTWDKLDGENLECWRHFVLACRLLCSKATTTLNNDFADAQFCKHTERLYGTNIITPNMHFHTHIKECIAGYGLLHGFWLFAFERYNGILGQQPNNNRSIEVQLMSRFLQNNRHIYTSSEFEEDRFFTSFYTRSSCRFFV